MSAEELERGFDYQGYLVFNGVFKTDLLETSIQGDVASVEQKLLDRLPTFSKGDPSQPGSGYEVIPIREYINHSDSLNQKLDEFADSLIGLRYYYEEFTEEEAQVDGSRETVLVSAIRDVDVYWAYPDFLFVRGPKGQAEKTRSETQVALKDTVAIEELGFSSDFLLWILYKYTNNGDLSPYLDVRRLTDSQTTGNEDLFGRRNVVNESTDLSKSVPLLTGLLSRKSLTMLEGHFTVEEYSVNAQISTDRVHIKASSGDIAESNPLRRMLIATEFLRALSRLKSDWEEFPAEKKYPPLDFFYELYEECQNQGVKIEFSPEDVLQKYARLRGESISEYDFE